MSYLRDKREERTGFQEHHPYSPLIDFQTDFVMIYGLDSTTGERIRDFRREGYQVHLMTGCAWGEYHDYLYGKWDGQDHWVDAQMDANGHYVLHGKDVPYMVPTMSFVRYLEEKLREAVDAGIEAIHVEEPEFWARSGYSQSFRREYEEHYGETWSDPQKSRDAAWKQARLKAWLYQRLIRYLAVHLKDYAKSRGQENLRFYVPTHSLINYSQWGIVSPEGLLGEIPEVDGIIAQVWTGTSREAQLYRGLYKERTFENAFLEYSVMKSLRFHEHQDIWFLQDPIEDNPGYTWEDYEYNYKRTLAAALLHPDVARYEICPWPWRVFTGLYPRPLHGQPGEISPDAKGIPESYASLLSGMFNLLGDMDTEHHIWRSGSSGIGIFISDTALYQRGFAGEPDPADAGLLPRDRRARQVTAEESFAIRQKRPMLDYLRQTPALTDFFGLALPLLKNSMACEILQLERLLIDPEYLKRYRVLVLSYEFMKPKSPEMNEVLANWVIDGGTLLYVGDEKDPWLEVGGWWHENRRTDQAASGSTPLKHLLRVLGLPFDTTEGNIKVGQGSFSRLPLSPTVLSLDPEEADAYVKLTAELAEQAGLEWKKSHVLHLERGIYDVAACMDEGTDETVRLEGPFVDLFDPLWPVIGEKILEPGAEAVLLSLNRVNPAENRILATSARVLSLEEENGLLRITLRTAKNIRTRSRIQCPGLYAASEGRAIRIDGDKGQLARCEVQVSRDEYPGHILVDYISDGKELHLALS